MDVRILISVLPGHGSNAYVYKEFLPLNCYV